jgi:hypothetical protein
VSRKPRTSWIRSDSSSVRTSNRLVSGILTRARPADHRAERTHDQRHHEPGRGDGRLSRRLRCLHPPHRAGDHP